MRNKALFLCFVFFMFLGGAFCDTIALKSGKQIDGTIKEKTSDSVKVDIEGITITYYLADIDSINGEKVVTESVSVIEDAGQENNSMPVEAPYVAQEPVSEDSASSSVLTEEKAKLSDEMSLSPEQAKMARGDTAGVIGGMILLIMFVAAIGYVYTSICLHFIAKKTGDGPLFLAWIPVAHYFLRLKVAKMNYLWILVPVGLVIVGFLVGLSASLAGVFGPAGKAPVAMNPALMLANFFFGAIYAAFSAFMWYKIALARNKKGWIGALMGISILNNVPFISFVSLAACGVIMGYLAFSE